jgi:hypothetical protein
VRAATLLAEIGDARGRFPTEDALVGVAGCAPSTRRPGKLQAVTFRYACDKKLRDAIVNFADDSRHASPWAADVYARARARNPDIPTPSASSPEPGSASSGAAGKTASPTTPTSTAATRTS